MCGGVSSVNRHHVSRPEAARFAHTHVSSEAQHVKPGEISPKQIIPCHPVESKVTYEGKVWTVSEINLATGMHTLTRPPGITKSDLRMLDLQPHIDPDESFEMTKEELSRRTARLPMVDGERRGDDGAMYRVKWLKPLPIDFDPEAHQYTWLPTGEVMSHSVTTILRAGKDPKNAADLRGHQAHLGSSRYSRSLLPRTVPAGNASRTATGWAV